MTDDYTPPTEVIKHAVSFPRERLGEPRPIKPEAFDRWLEQVKAEAKARALADSGLLARPLPSREEIAEYPGQSHKTDLEMLANKLANNET